MKIKNNLVEILISIGVLLLLIKSSDPIYYTDSARYLSGSLIDPPLYSTTIFLMKSIFGTLNSLIIFQTLIIGFSIMLIGALVFSLGIINSTMNIIFLLSLIMTAVGTYAIRALYFAVFNEGKIPVEITGTAVGIISIVGYTPDIFVTPIMGYLIDNYPGIVGYQYVFMMLVMFSLLGLLASIKFQKITIN